MKAMPDVAAIVLAAGHASRFGGGAGDSKVVAALDGEPMVRRVVRTALGSRASPVVVVTGNAAEEVARALDGVAVTLVENPDWASGMAGSLAAGLAALGPSAAGALVLLADMPLVRAATLDRLIDAFDGEVDAVVPHHEGKPGNPVLVGRAMFADLAASSGDAGARKLLARGDRRVSVVEVDDPGITIDVDTREALAALNRPPRP